LSAGTTPRNPLNHVPMRKSDEVAAVRGDHVPRDD